MIFLAKVSPRPPERHEQRVLLRQAQAAEQPEKPQEPQQQIPADEFEQICRLFGALSERDTSHTVVKVYRVVVRRAHPQNGIGSSELAEIETINRLTVLHHLNRLAELGMLEKRGSRYYPRGFDEIFDEFEKQALENINRARLIARQLEKD